MKTVTFARRDTVLRKYQNLKMARSPHAFIRGTTIQFYRWLAELKKGTLPEGPAIWICGDCHVSNLGPLAGVKGDVSVSIRDLDQTVIGNPAHDIIRLGLSLTSAARGSALPGVTAARMMEQMIEGYVETMSDRAGRSHRGRRPRSIRSCGALLSALGGIWPKSASRISIQASRSVSGFGRLQRPKKLKSLACSRPTN
jgi:uncharacterized protein (DUF2252 family)